MFNVKATKQFEDLLSELRQIVSERDAGLDAIREKETALAEERKNLATAQQRVDCGEREAALTPGRLAIASKAAQKAVADTKLRVKTVSLQLDELRSKVSAKEEKLSAAKGKMKRFMGMFLAAMKDDLSAQFDVAIGNIMRLVFKTYALKQHYGASAVT